MKSSLAVAAVAALSFATLTFAEGTKADAGDFPTPAELVAKMKAQKEETASKLQVAYFDFTGPIAEAPSGPSLFGGGATTMRDLTDRLRAARYDDEVGAVLMTFKPGAGFGFSQAEEIVAQINGLKEAGKRVFVYADSYDPSTYLVASAATDVCLMEGGEVFLPGISAELMFYRGMFDKFGIKPSYVQVGEYKGADESYMNTEPSPEMTEEMNKLVDAIYDRMVTKIAGNRSLSKEDVRKTIDNVVLLASNAKEKGYVDHLVDADGIRDIIAETMEREGRDDINLIGNYAQEAKEEVDFSNIFAVLAQMNKQEPETDAEKVALVYATGTIVDGESSNGGGLPIPFIGGGGQTVGSETIRRAMREIERDDLIKSVVIRIDSPGGSALASEAMWQSVRRVAAEKPVIISVGGMAASGGYYLLAAGDHVYADPSAIVGSIGVVGGKLTWGGIYEQLGLTTASFNRGAHADLFSSTEPWDEREEAMVRSWMQQTYDQFESRVMAGRGDKIEDFDAIAKGRIFLAGDAIDLGMVDELGGLEDAIAHAAGAAGFTTTDYEIKVVPQPKFNPNSLFGGLVQTPVSAETQVIWSMLPDNAKVLITRQLKMTMLMQDRPVVLLSPWIVNID
ncbi:MAG: signal peptide peptidase SppA [Planctomycetota bacterium]